MGIKKTTVASAVSVASSKASKKAEPAQPTDQKTNWDSLLINNSSESTDADGKRYVHYLNKDRLVRSAPGWGSAKGQTVEFVIFATDEDGNPLQDLPEPRFGSAQDVDYYKAKYSLQKGYFVNDSLCRNGRHRISFYHIHITNVVKKAKAEAEVEVE